MNVTTEQYAVIRESLWSTGRYFGVKVRDLPISYVKWMANNGSENFNRLQKIAEMELRYRLDHPDEITGANFDLLPAYFQPNSLDE